MPWRVVIIDEVEAWLTRLQADDPGSFALVIAAIDRLEAEGPTLGRPLVDRVKAPAITT